MISKTRLARVRGILLVFLSLLAAMFCFADRSRADPPAPAPSLRLKWAEQFDPELNCVNGNGDIIETNDPNIINQPGSDWKPMDRKD